jgi:two-component system chemotaxis response regulator CheY
MRVLVADDSKVSREIITMHLRKVGIDHIDEVEDGSEVIAKLRQLKKGEEYTAIILDVVMPKVTGLAALKEIRLMAPDTKIVMCTAMNDLQTVKIARGFGVNAYVLKPFTGEKLIEVLKEAIIS